MHPECSRYLRQFSSMKSLSVIEIGSRDINGSARSFWPNARWIGLDLHAGPAVDVVGNAETYRPDSLVDLVVCCEVLEHAANWRELIASAASWLQPWGRLIVTCAGPGRPEHSAIDGEHRLLDGEHYGNLTVEEVEQEFKNQGLVEIVGTQVKDDTQVTGLKAPS